MSLAERVHAYVTSHPDQTVDDIARGLQARTVEVRDILLGEGFSSRARLAYPSDRARVYDLASRVSDGPGRARKPSQCDRIMGVLRDGRPHTSAEIHTRCGYSRLNSRVAELRRRGHNIVCEHVEGASTGPEAYAYQLIATSGETDALPPSSVSPDAAPPPIEGEQLDIEAAA